MIKHTIIFSVFICLTSLAKAQTAPDKEINQVSETEKIEYLINSVEQLENAQLYRNGTWYDAKTAATHLRMKLSKAGNRIKTAQLFIDKIASNSSMTGEAYKIKFSDGKIVSTKEYFFGKLKDIEGKQDY